MPLVVEDGTGLSNADSYISVANTDSYFTARGMPTEWHEKTPTEKEEALRVATRYVDINYRSRWSGSRTKQTQALAWPRAGVLDADGWGVDTNRVPQEVKDATCEVALRHVKDPTILLPDVSVSDGSLTSESVTIGPISESKSYSGSKSSRAKLSFVDALLRVYLISANMLYRG